MAEQEAPDHTEPDAEELVGGGGGGGGGEGEEGTLPAAPGSALRGEVEPCEHTAALREVFALLDKGDGTVPLAEMGVLMGALAVHPSEAEEQEVLAACAAEHSASPAGGSGLTFSIFHAFMSRKMLEQTHQDRAKEAFKHLEDGAGFITLPELSEWDTSGAAQSLPPLATLPLTQHLQPRTPTPTLPLPGRAYDHHQCH